MFAEWDGAKKAFVALDQTNAGPRAVTGAAKPLGTWRVQGHKAHMFGFCGSKGLPSCKIQNITLVLAWKAWARLHHVLQQRVAPDAGRRRRRSLHRV